VERRRAKRTLLPADRRFDRWGYYPVTFVNDFFTLTAKPAAHRAVTLSRRLSIFSAAQPSGVIMTKTRSFPTLCSIPVIVTSLVCIAVASPLPASAQQTAQQDPAQKRYEAWAACRREADNAVPLANMISDQAP
jgi:hypothetical protein